MINKIYRINKIGIEKTITNIVFLLCFFPTTIFFLIPYETQPLYVPFSIYLVCTKFKFDRAHKVALIFMCLVIVYVVISILAYEENYFNIILNGASYLCPILLYLSLYKRMDYLNYKVYLYSLFAWIIVGIIQTYETFTYLKPVLLEIGKLAFSDRFLVNPTHDGRGAFFLASEPSISAPTIILFLGTGIFFYFKEKILLKSTLPILAVFFMIYLNKSATLGVVFITLLFGLFMYLFMTINKYRLIFALFLALAAFLIIDISVEYSESTRLFLSFSKIVEAFLDDRSVLDIALELGSARVLPLLLGYMSLIDNYSLGHGIASWSMPGHREMVQDAIGINIHDFSNYGYSAATIPYGDIVKPQSFFSLVSYDFGIPGLVVVITMIFIFIGRNNEKINSCRSYIFSIPAIMWLLLFGLVTLPMPWVMLAYAHYFKREN